MGSAGVGTWIALVSCPLFALLVLVVLFRDPNRGKGKGRERDGKERESRAKPKQATAAPKPPGLPPPSVPPLPVPMTAQPMAAPPVPQQPAIARAKPPKQFTKPSKKAIELAAEPDCTQLQVAAQRAASAAGAAVLAARAAAKQAAQAAGEAAKMAAARDNAQKALDAVKVSITATRAGLAVDPGQNSEDPAQREVARAALAAYKRGDISVEEMQQVWKRVGGWDEQREESEKELLRLRGEETKARKALEAAESAVIPAQRAAQHAEAIAHARGHEAAMADQAARTAYAVAEECRKKSLRDGVR